MSKKAPVEIGVTSWLSIIDEEVPRYVCPIIKQELSTPCQIHACPLWAHNPKVYNCAGALSALKSTSSEERLAGASTSQRDKKGNLRSAADGKLSFHDLSYLYGFSRQRIEGYVNTGRLVMETLAPMFAHLSQATSNETQPTKRVGNPILFSHTNAVSHEEKYKDEAGEEVVEVTRVCICCEAVIAPDDEEMVIAVIERNEVAWCSRECAKELTIDAYLVSNRYKRHWTDVALSKDLIDERSRVREITQERMDALAAYAKKLGFQP